MQQMRKRFTEGANTRAVRVLMIGLAALVVLSVSGYGTVIYIQLMSKVFPSGPLLIACYMGAAANVVLMLILLVGKFVWFRPGALEVGGGVAALQEGRLAERSMGMDYKHASSTQPTSSLTARDSPAPLPTPSSSD